MSEVGAADSRLLRSNILRSKAAELSGIVTSRKRKLREFFAVCDNESPIPQIDLSNPDAPSTNIAEARFLEVTDILQNRLFDESNLPTRRQLRSNASKQRSPIRKASPDTRQSDASRKAGKLQRDRSKPRKSRAATPGAKSDGGKSTAIIDEGTSVIDNSGVAMQRSSSKSSQTDLPADSAAVLNDIVEETFENATHTPPPMPDTAAPAKDLECDRIRTRVESRPNSPGVDPRKAMPISAEDAAQLSEPLVQGLGSHDVPHKAITAHLPPREVQERHLRQAQKARENREDGGQLSISLPPRYHGKNAEALSSPGSTNDALSATTPAMHDASTDTSPENESSRFDADRMDTKEDDIPTPPEMRRSPEEIAEKEEHDRILKARIDIAREEIMRSSPSAVDNQLLVEQAAMVPSEDSQVLEDTHSEEVAGGGQNDALTHEAREVIQDAVEDEEEVVGAPTPEDRPSGADEAGAIRPREAQEEQLEIPDSESDPEAVEQSPEPDAMEIDVTTVKDSFESNAGLESAPVSSPPVAAQIVEAPGESKKSSVTPTTSTPRQTSSIPAPAPPIMERMTTRVASGAMRHKSVSEILGETPKPTASTSAERSSTKGDSDSAVTSNSASRSATPQSPGARIRALAEKNKEKERSKLSTVVFPGRQTKPSASDKALVAGGSHQSQALKDDYFMPLWHNLATASLDKRGSPTLDQLLSTAHKTITTSNAYVPIHESQTTMVLKRIHNLQTSNKWSLRQPKRSLEPIRPTTHRDVLLQEVKWMRTDFREERKWKMTVARNLAYDCAEWVSSSSEDRKLLQVKAAIPKLAPVEDIEMAEVASQSGTHPTPDLVASGEFDSPMDDLDEEPRLNLMDTISPAAIFGLQDDDVVFGLRRSPTTDKLLDELPMYGSPLKVPQSDLPTSEIDPDRSWKRPALPLSKYVEGRMELKLEPRPRKRSRFEYEQEDDDEEQVIFGEKSTKQPPLPPESTDVALFNPEHRHIRERIHSAHQFRPPSEFQMPLQSFFESRVASQWTWDEDNELKSHVQKYSYNWSLISSIISSKSMMSSGAERRTPWECFERWIHLEGLPTDMQKTHYFRAYTTRIETANRLVMAQAVPQLPNANGQMQSRKRPTTSMRVERRRNSRYMYLVDAMRKLAKKRETTLQKQQHAAGMAAMRKAQEVPHVPNKPPMHATTPQDFSRMKAEREEQLKERLHHLQQRQEAQRRAAMQQARAGPNGQPVSLPNGVAPRPPANGAMGPSSSTPGSQNLTVPGQNRPRPMPPQMAGQTMPNGLRVPQMGLNGAAHPPMQGQLPLPNPALDVGLVTRAHQISQHQQAILRQQQGQIPGQSPQMHNSPPRMNGMPAPGFPGMQGNMMAPFNTNMNGVSTPPPNSHSMSPGQGQAGSPRMGQVPPNMAGLTPVQMMERTIKNQNPNATPEQITAQITKHMLDQQMAQQRHRASMAQNAMNAAAGPSGGSAMSMNGMGAGQGTPQLYAQMLRQQQENQQKQQQAQHQAANAVAQQTSGGNSGQGHAHRASSGSNGK